jgi:GNAT superfamily N-acetyltransferase
MPIAKIERAYGPAQREIGKAHDGRQGQTSLDRCDHEREGQDRCRAAETYFDWMYVRLLWVADRRRGRGWGRSLIAKAKAEASRHGVRNVWLDSFTFQAPDFYKKQEARLSGVRTTEGLSGRP